MRQRFLPYLLINVVFGSVCRAEFQVNSLTVDSQLYPSVAVNNDVLSLLPQRGNEVINLEC